MRVPKRDELRRKAVGMMSLSLVVGVDGSESSLQAVDWAVDEAARHGLPLRLVHASRWERYEGGLPFFGTGRPPSGKILAERIAASAMERVTLRNPDVKACGEALAEDTVTALLAESREAYAVVTGSHGRGELAGSLLGSVSLAVAARAVCPVVVVRGGERNREGAFGRVVLAVGDPAEGSAAARFAFHEARARNAEVQAVRTWLCPAERHAGRTLFAHEATTLLYEEQATRILNEVLDPIEREHDAITCHRDVVEGRAYQVLLDMSEHADLLVVGARRRPDPTGLQLGRVSHAVLHHCACPVAVVPERL